MLIQYLINVKPLCVAYSPRPDEVMIMRYVQPLSDEQRALLEKTMKEDTAFRARSRAHSLLLSAAGTPIQAIAQAYQVHRVTVSAWITKWEHHGAQSLHDQPRSGRPAKLTPDEQALAQHYIKEEPRSLKGVVAIVFGSIFAWWRSFQMQPVDMGDQLHFTGPPAEVETEHLVRTFGRRTPDPQADQQAGDQGHIHLYPHAVGRLTQQVPAAQHTFHPPKKQLHGPPIPIRQRDEVGVEVQPIRHQHQHLGRPVAVRLPRRNAHDPQRLRQQLEVVRGAQPPEHRIPLDPGGLRGRRDGALLLDLIGWIGLHTANEAAWQVMQLLKYVIVCRAPIKDREPPGLDEAPQ